MSCNPCIDCQVQLVGKEADQIRCDKCYSIFPLNMQREKDIEKELTLEQQANVALIAAGPELLEACEYVKKYHEPRPLGGIIISQNALENILKAIAKAKGESNI